MRPLGRSLGRYHPNDHAVAMGPIQGMQIDLSRAIHERFTYGVRLAIDSRCMRERAGSANQWLVRQALS